MVVLLTLRGNGQGGRGRKREGEKEGRGGRGERLVREEGGRKGRGLGKVSLHPCTLSLGWFVFILFCLTIKGIGGGYYTVGSLMVSVFSTK